MATAQVILSPDVQALVLKALKKVGIPDAKAKIARIREQARELPESTSRKKREFLLRFKP
jgi:hypothetical protein